MSSSGGKKKKSKLEKIYELQASNRGLKEENKNLRKQLKRGDGASVDDRSMMSSHNEEKLLEAMKALKRVTVKQEMSLNTIRSKAEKRRHQIAERDDHIKSLQQEIRSLRQAQKARKDVDGSSDLNDLRSKVEDLEMRTSEQESQNKTLTLQLEASEDKARNLQKQLHSARGLMERAPSSRSLRSADTSASEFDLARMRKELASKIEQIVLLEFDLEMCKDELHELRQRQGGGYEDGDRHNVVYNSGPDDFFSDDEEDDEWR